MGMPNKKSDTDDILRRGARRYFGASESPRSSDRRDTNKPCAQGPAITEQEIFRIVRDYSDNAKAGKSKPSMRKLDQAMGDDKIWQQWLKIASYPNGLPRNFKEALEVAKFYRLNQKEEPEMPSQHHAAEVTGFPQQGFSVSYEALIEDILEGHENKFSLMPPSLDEIEAKLGHIRLYSPD